MKKWTALLLTLCLAAFSLAAAADTHQKGAWEYSDLADGTVRITDYNKEAKTLKIPDKLGGKKVTAIAMQAFVGCGELGSVQIPATVTELEGNPFYNCSFLTTIKVNGKNPALEVVGGVLFRKTDHRLVCYPCGTQETGSPNGYEIPDGVEIIGNTAFSMCNRLNFVTIPDTVTTIEAKAFFGCTYLSDIRLPDSVKTIGDNAFGWNNALEQFTFPAGVVSVGANPFQKCPKLAVIEVSPDNPELSVEGGVLFSTRDHRLIACPQGLAAESYEIPDGTAVIGDFAFSGCETLKSVTIPDSVTQIGRSAFNGCLNLTLSVPEGSYAAGYCEENQLSYVTRPAAVKADAAPDGGAGSDFMLGAAAEAPAAAEEPKADEPAAEQEPAAAEAPAPAEPSEPIQLTVSGETMTLSIREHGFNDDRTSYHVVVDGCNVLFDTAGNVRGTDNMPFSVSLVWGSGKYMTASTFGITTDPVTKCYIEYADKKPFDEDPLFIAITPKGSEVIDGWFYVIADGKFLPGREAFGK